MEYKEFLKSKKITVNSNDRIEAKNLNSNLFGFQSETVEFLCNRGGGAAFLDTGLGKSIIALESQRLAIEKYNKPSLMLAPLAVAPQHIKESEKFGIIECEYLKNPLPSYKPKIYITNYENAHKFDADDFCMVVLDESSIIKNYTGATSRKLMEQFKHTKHKICCTATPSPNDYMELGQHSSFLDIMASNEMLARWFIADQSAMGTYRLKKSAVDDYWSWVANWSRCLSKPSDLGYSDEGYDLPPLEIKRHIVSTDISFESNGMLFRSPELSATSIHSEKRKTAYDKAVKAMEISNNCDSPHVIWCDTNYEADEVMKLIPDAIEVSGSMDSDKKEERLVAFSEGKVRTLVTKPKIAGFGLNWQHSHEPIYMGLSYSYESFYQSLRRFYRFGQKEKVTAHVVMAETEEAIWQVIQAKKKSHEKMKNEMTKAMKKDTIEKGIKNHYNPIKEAILPKFL